MCRPPNERERAAARERLFCPTLVRTVLRWLEKLGVPRCDRGDVAGQVWVSAWESWPRFDPTRGTPERWLNGITVHVASRYHERAQRRREELVDWIEAVDPAPDAADAMESDSIRTGIIDAVNDLDPDLRSILVAHDLNGVSMAQMAEDVGLPISTLYKRRAKAIEALREVLRSRYASELSMRRGGRLR
ncbi:sigma-70 family RNA polymerase sigma factor [Sorangium sp. So ce1014]|uniref:sigma-70 family RNA polymerase sigma factor n=1 Tax=Sorangium sp. So ce1014 TaxID=3133326 RepID=UPI003F60EEF2